MEIWQQYIYINHWQAANIIMLIQISFPYSIICKHMVQQPGILCYFINGFESLSYLLNHSNAYGTFMYLCVCNETCQRGCFFTYSTIRGVIFSALLHSGCKSNWHFFETKAAFFSAHAKSSLL